MSSPAPADAPVLPGYRHVYSGKVRDLYVPASQDSTGQDGTGQKSADPHTADHVLVVASDRISAYDHVLPTPVPDKGMVLTALSLWWFERLADVVPNHLLAVDGPAIPPQVRGRAMLCRRLQMYPVECVARGYLTGSALADYRATGSVCGVALPPGLRDGDRLPAPVFTPATKAGPGEHDENVDLAAVERAIGGRAAESLRELTLVVYGRAEALARERGILLADTKLEFGTAPGDPTVVLGDEVLTPDSSRFWPADVWEPGRAQPSYDKQYVRDWLTSSASGWDRSSDSPPPPLPQDVVQHTRDRYVQAYERLTGVPFQ